MYLSISLNKNEDIFIVFDPGEEKKKLYRGDCYMSLTKLKKKYHDNKLIFNDNVETHSSFCYTAVAGHTCKGLNWLLWNVDIVDNEY